MGMIELRSVVKRFGNLTAVDQVSLDVEEGEIVGLLGHNGAGKTTLIRVINGLLEPNSGTVRVDGRDPVADGHLVRGRTGVLTEYPALDEFLTTRENLEVYAAVHGLSRAASDARIDALLHALGLWDKRNHAARQLSAGLKQRVALARAVVHDPAVLLLDEPTTNMDPVAARRVRQMIVSAVQERGRTVLLSTHNLVEAEALCDRVAILRDGALLMVGTPAELRGRVGGGHGVRIRVGPGQAGDALRQLRDAGPDTRAIDEASPVDEEHLEVSGDVNVPEVIATLVDAGIEIHAVHPLSGTLEDLYVALHVGTAEPGDVEPAVAGTSRARSATNSAANAATRSASTTEAVQR